MALQLQTQQNLPLDRHSEGWKWTQGTVGKSKALMPHWQHPSWPAVAPKPQNSECAATRTQQTRALSKVECQFRQEPGADIDAQI